jgi:hypothetical protein
MPESNSEQWWAAHVITYIRFIDGNQEDYGVEESIRLVHATEEDVWKKAQNIFPDINIGEDIGDVGICQGRPAVRVFAGIRKIMRILDPFETGTEITYSDYIVSDEETLVQLINDETAAVEYLGSEDSEEAFPAEVS